MENIYNKNDLKKKYRKEKSCIEIYTNHLLITLYNISTIFKYLKEKYEKCCILFYYGFYTRYLSK